jgi:ribosomal protein S18 acetylase RimI-like enzyme
MTAIERQQEMLLQMRVVFRPAEREDLPKLEWYGAYTHYRRVFQRAFEDQLAGRRLMLLADVNGWPVGQIFIQLEMLDEPFPGDRKRAYMYSLRVMDAFQHQGIGTALVQEAQSILVERGYGSVSIAAAKENEAARRMYEHLGFHVLTEDPGRWHYVDHEGHTRQVVEPCWILEKQLQP